MNEILVSVNCITYNHEDYIRNTINGILMQKTNFKFELLIHDDASDDNTREIIKEYHRKYPDIIKPIFQTENQYSKGEKIGIFNYIRAIGKYVAFCEGDDYWTDPYKLQKQVNFMESNPDYSICGHLTSQYNIQTKTIVGMIPKNLTTEVSINNLVNGTYFHTSSLLINREKMLDSEGNIIIPKFYLNSPVGDYALQLYMLTIGKGHLINDVMSQYNWNVSGSWTSTTLSSIKARNHHIKKLIEMLCLFNEETNYKYDDFVKNATKFQENKMFDEEESTVDIKILLSKLPKLTDVYIFGTGSFGKSVAKILMENGIEISGYIDNDNTKVGQKIDGIPVNSLRMIETKSTILVCSQWHKEIADQLLENGYYHYYKLISWQN